MFTAIGTVKQAMQVANHLHMLQAAMDDLAEFWAATVDEAEHLGLDEPRWRNTFATTVGEVKFR